jgi:hypothetical protein
MRVNSGINWQAQVMADTLANGTGAYAAGNYIALSTNATAPGAGDSTLAGEIVLAGGGLIRKQALYGHTSNAANYTLTATFTANGVDSLPATIQKIGVFNAVTSGTLIFESALSPTATLSASGDAVTITETVSI